MSTQSERGQVQEEGPRSASGVSAFEAGWPGGKIRKTQGEKASGLEPALQSAVWPRKAKTKSGSGSAQTENLEQRGGR